MASLGPFGWSKQQTVKRTAPCLPRSHLRPPAWPSSSSSSSRSARLPPRPPDIHIPPGAAADDPGRSPEPVRRHRQHARRRRARRPDAEDPASRDARPVPDRGFRYQDPNYSACTATSALVMLNTIALNGNGGTGFRWVVRLGIDPRQLDPGVGAVARHACRRQRLRSARLAKRPELLRLGIGALAPIPGSTTTSPTRSYAKAVKTRHPPADPDPQAGRDPGLGRPPRPVHHRLRRPERQPVREGRQRPLHERLHDRRALPDRPAEGGRLRQHAGHVRGLATRRTRASASCPTPRPTAHTTTRTRPAPSRPATSG